MDFLKRIKDCRRKKKVSALVLVGFVALSIIVLIYLQLIIISNEYLSNNNLNNDFYKLREIDTPFKLMLNGYLGIFFRFEKFGYLPLLLIPCLIYLFFSWKQVSKYQKNILWIFTFFVILVGVKGFHNFRYAFTIFPFVIITIFWLVYSFIDRLKHKSHDKRLQLHRSFSVAVYGLIVLLLFISIFSKKDKYIAYWKYANHFQYDQSHNLNLLSSMGKLDLVTNKILAVNVNDFFYHTDLKSIKYEDLVKISDQKSFLEAMVDENVRFVLADYSVHIFENYRPLSAILKDNSKTEIFKKEGSLYLYVIKDVPAN